MAFTFALVAQTRKDKEATMRVCRIIFIFIGVVFGGNQVYGVGPAIDPLFPMVGKIAGTPYPYPEDIARDPNDVPKHPLANGATLVITAPM